LFDDIGDLLKQLPSARDDLTKMILSYLKDKGLSPEELVIALLSISALIASSTGCEEKTYKKLAEIAFAIEEANVTLIKQKQSKAN